MQVTEVKLDRQPGDSEKVSRKAFIVQTGGIACVATAETVRGSPMAVWEHGGKKYCSGLFRMHDEKGFSLTDSLIECQKRGWVPCLLEFRAEALRAGWSREKISGFLQEAAADSGYLEAGAFADWKYYGEAVQALR
jgi:hypothetical protein